MMASQAGDFEKMTENPAHAPRTDPTGQFTRICTYRNCGEEFRTNNVQARYCCAEHRTAERNARHYQRYRSRIINRVLRNKKHI